MYGLVIRCNEEGSEAREKYYLNLDKGLKQITEMDLQEKFGKNLIRIMQIEFIIGNEKMERRLGYSLMRFN